MVGWVFAGIQELLAHVVEVGDEVRDRCLGRHRAVLEGDAVGNHTITEDDRYFSTLSTRDGPGCCKVARIFHVHVLPVDVGRLLENLFIRNHPLDADIGHGLHHRRGDGLLAGPHADRAEAEFLLKEVHAGDEMVLNVLRPRLFVDADAVFHRPAVHHQQRHDGVVVRGGGQLHLPAGGQLAVHGENVAHVVMLCIQHVVEVRQRVIAVLHEQGDQAVITMAAVVVTLDVIGRKLVEVPQHLKIQEILRSEQFVVHDRVGFEVVKRHVVEFLVSHARGSEPAKFLVTLRDVVDPPAVPKRLELHRVKFEVRGIGVAALTPRALGDVGVHVQRFVDVVLHQLFNERRDEVVGHLGVGVRQDTRRIHVLGHGVHPHPRHFVHPGEFVLVVRLVLVEDDGQIQCIVHLLNASGLDDGKLLRRGNVADVFSVPGVCESFRSVVARRVLHGERGPNVPAILPLGVHHDVEPCGLAQGRPRERQLGGLIA